MAELFSRLAAVLLKAGIVVLVANEVRGFVLAAPVLYTMYLSGGTMMALWLGFCSLAGIFLSVAAPLCVVKKIKILRLRAA